MKVFITGATGFVGSYVVPAVLAAGHEVQVLARGGSARKLPESAQENPKLSIHDGDLLKPETLESAAEGCDAVIHLVGIIEEDRSEGITFERLHVQATANMNALARRREMKRFVHMSALGSRDTAASQYHRTKYRGEHLVKLSGIPWVIFRPSLLFGKGDGFVNLQQKFIRNNAPVIVPGSGENLFQPVAAENVAEGFAKALTAEDAPGKIYEVGGPRAFSFNQIVAMIAEAKGVKKYFVLHPPVLIMKPIATIMHAIWPGFPVNGDQVVMLEENSVCEAGPFFKDFGITPKEFTVAALKAYI